MIEAFASAASQILEVAGTEVHKASELLRVVSEALEEYVDNSAE